MLELKKNYQTTSALMNFINQPHMNISFTSESRKYINHINISDTCKSHKYISHINQSTMRDKI